MAGRRDQPVFIVNYSQLVDSGIEEAVQEAVASSGRKGSKLDKVDAAMLEGTFSHALDLLRHAEVARDVLSAPDHAFAAFLQSEVAALGEESGAAITPVAGTDAAELKYDNLDPGWILVVWEKFKNRLPRHFSPPQPPSIPDEIGADGAIALLGDWGTALYGAPPCSEAVTQLDDLLGVVHLGDVYYAGTEKEEHRNLIDYWPAQLGGDAHPKVLSRACDSNHEMYSGGEGYFRVALPAFRQTASAFSFMNEHWLFVGIDSACDHKGYFAKQKTWLTRLLAEHLGTRKLVLFSHHYPFSHFKEENLSLRAIVGDVLAQHQAFSWYWGHEHLLALYDAHPESGVLGRCVGHSGFPYKRPTISDSTAESLPDGSKLWDVGEQGPAPPARILDGPNKWIKGHESMFGPNGFMVLRLQGPDLLEEVRNAEGRVLKTIP